MIVVVRSEAYNKGGGGGGDGDSSGVGDRAMVLNIPGMALLVEEEEVMVVAERDIYHKVIKFHHGIPLRWAVIY